MPESQGRILKHRHATEGKHVLVCAEDVHEREVPCPIPAGGCHIHAGGTLHYAGVIKRIVLEEGLSPSNGRRKWLIGKENTGSPMGKRACTTSTKITGLLISNNPKKISLMRVSLNPISVKFIVKIYSQIFIT